MKSPVPLLLVPVVLLFFQVTSCVREPSVPEGGISRDSYLRGLAEAGLLDNPRVTRWQERAEQAVDRPEPILPPARVEWDVEEGSEDARVYSLTLDRRTRLSVDFELQGDGFLILDVLREGSGSTREETIVSTNSGSLSFTARRQERYLLRLQPEIYAYGVAQMELVTVD
ncbi:MAG: hypothetical protein ACOC45_00215 [Alkalispirochaetaceae bacterium]